MSHPRNANQPAPDPAAPLRKQWHDLLAELRALLEGETDPIANAANTAALLFDRVPRINWAGFYFLRGEELVLGPFQGKPACVRLPFGQGVCGTAAARRETIVVADVHAFSGHIVCDTASNAEIVVPLVRDGQVIGVLDIDSPYHNRFTEDDRTGCETAAEIYLHASHISFPSPASREREGPIAPAMGG